LKIPIFLYLTIFQSNFREINMEMSSLKRWRAQNMQLNGVSGTLKFISVRRSATGGLTALEKVKNKFAGGVEID